MEKRIKWSRTLSLVNILIWMGLIFYLSDQPATQSANASDSFGLSLFKFLSIDLNAPDNAYLLDISSFIVRKAAHMYLYFVLALVLRLYFVTFNIKNKYKNLLTLGITFLYAISDEIHQLFIEGRACQFQDILIDLAGGAIGLLVFMLIRHRMKK